VLAAAGHGSRRSVEELILAGRVEVDGQTVTELGTRVDPAQQDVRVDGVSLPRRKFIYYVLNKPTNVVTTHRDPAGRTRVIDLVPADQRLFAVGRLDLSSEGLILLTNDGDLANRLAHPRYGVEKVYHVEVAGKPEPEHLAKLREGVRFAEGLARAEKVIVKRERPHSTVLEITLREGKNREIRRMLARVGHKVQRLRRIAFGPLRLGELPTGAFRELTPHEIEKLREVGRDVAHASRRARPKRKPRPASSFAQPHSYSGKPRRDKASRPAGVIIGGERAGQRKNPSWKGKKR
jgi:23S rRNA pseudouridine2605 synthase